MEPITNEPQEVFARNKFNTNIIHVVDIILDAAAETRIGENWCLLDNK